MGKVTEEQKKVARELAERLEKDIMEAIQKVVGEVAPDGITSEVYAAIGLALSHSVLKAGAKFDKVGDDHPMSGIIFATEVSAHIKSHLARSIMGMMGLGDQLTEEDEDEDPDDPEGTIDEGEGSEGTDTEKDEDIPLPKVPTDKKHVH